MKESDHRLIARDRVFVLHLRKTLPIFPDRAVTTSDNRHVVVAIVDYLLYESPLVVIRSGKQLHSRRNTVQFQKCLHDLLAFLPKVTVCGTNEHLIPLFHLAMISLEG